MVNANIVTINSISTEPVNIMDFMLQIENPLNILVIIDFKDRSTISPPHYKIPSNGTGCFSFVRAKESDIVMVSSYVRS